MALIRANTSGGGGGIEKPTLLWSNESGSQSNITVDHSAYSYLIFVCGYKNGGTKKKMTLCDKTQPYHALAVSTWSSSAFTYMTAYIQSGQISFPRTDNQHDACYAVYGCNSLSIDYTDIWASGDIA